ncbi:MAG: hypothetical protein H6822_23115 [Planctomycetaceae bacterium]|nr:hypothetical protein [Planctomycetales bacterium]MCB9925088.1 hypothetical protein [Planctomycetaceae bacterium]
MIEAPEILWLVAGAVSGAMHAKLLRRATARLTIWAPALCIIRIGVVATCLLASAFAGAILAAAIGWVAGFLTVCGLLCLDQEYWVASSSVTPPND